MIRGKKRSVGKTGQFYFDLQKLTLFKNKNLAKYSYFNALSGQLVIEKYCLSLNDVCCFTENVEIVT